MKPFFLSFATMLLFAATSFAQAQVEVFNNTSTCDFDVTVTSIDGTCSTIAVYGPITINFGSSFVFSESDPNVVDFIVNAQLNGILAPPTFIDDIHIWTSCSTKPIHTYAPSTNTCGTGNNVVMHHDPNNGVFPNGIALIED